MELQNAEVINFNPTIVYIADCKWIFSRKMLGLREKTMN